MFTLQRTINKRSLLLRWFVSYVVILLIPMFLSMVIYFFSYGVITRSSEKIYAASLERSCAEIDSMVRTVFQTLDYLTINNNVQKLSYVRNSPDPNEHWAIVQLVRELRNYQLILPFIDDLFIVINQTGTIVSTIGYINEELYYSINYKDKEFDYGSFHDLIQKIHRKNEVYPVEDNLLFFRSTLDSDLKTASITVAASIKQRKFTEHFIDENGPVMYIKDTNNGFEFFAPGVMSTDPNRVSRAYRSLSAVSDATNWQYICLFPVSVLKGQARKIQLITFIGFLVSILLGLLLSYGLSKKNYEPVRKLMSYFLSPEKNDAPGENEFAWLEKRTGEFLKENQDTRYAIRKYHARLRYSRDTEQKLYNLIRAGDSEGVSAHLKQVYRDNRFPEDPSGRMRQFLAYDLLGTIIKGIGQDDSDFPEDVNIEEIPLSDLPAFVEETALSVCENNRKTITTRNSKALCEKVKDYINENFRDADLNISQTGYHFNISPFYLSSNFREETGQSLLGYINSLRIEEGKRLLEEGHNVMEIAEMTGFHDAGAFIRVFKKLTGITPGQYRKIS